MIAVIAVIMSMFVVPATSKANVVHYLRPYQVTNGTAYDGVAGKSFTMAGTKYTYGVTSKQDYNNMYAEFYLGEQVSSVTFSLGHLDNDGEDAGTFQLYLDEELQEEFTRDLTYDMPTVTVTVNTSGKKHMKVIISGNYARYVIYDFVATPKVATVKQHSFVEETLTEATFGVAGVIRHVCSVCGAYYTTVTEPGTRNMADPNIAVSLAQTNYVYNGKVRTPKVTVTYARTALIQGTDYAVSYAKNKNAGTVKVIITGLGYYDGKTSTTFTIQPKKTNLSSVKNKKNGKAVVKWKKNTQADGYEVVYSTNDYFYYANTKNVSKKTSVTLSNLPKGYTYYVKVRAYKKSNGVKIYGDYGKVKKVYIKK